MQNDAALRDFGSANVSCGSKREFPHFGLMSASTGCGHGIRRLGQYLVEMPRSAFELTLGPAIFNRDVPVLDGACAPRPQTSMVRFSAPDYTPGVEFRVFVAAVRDEVAAKISIQLRAKAGTPGAPETLTFSYMVGGEQDAPVELRIGDSLYRLDKDDLVAFARAIAGKG